MLLSIIVPVYNIEAYIGPCLNSVLDQNLPKDLYEIIIIDDGSKDNSSQIVREYGALHKNITVFRQENIGLGGARKSGMRLATGKYIYFLDGDDYLARNCLKLVLEAMELHQLDILGFKVLKTDQLNLNSSMDVDPSISDMEIMDGIRFLGTHPEYRVEVWWYLIKREFLDTHGPVFEDKRFVNDSYFTPGLFTKAEKVAFLPKDIYRYVQRPNSITSSKSPKHYGKHIGDLQYAIFKMQDIMDGLPEHPYADQAKNTIRIKQESYVFFALVRFSKSELSWSYLRDLLASFRQLGCYPMKKLTSAAEYKGMGFKMGTLLFNNALSRDTTLLLLRIFFSLKRKLF
jgi:glycosyltransferase involved in cell wall biosynthesis